MATFKVKDIEMLARGAKETTPSIKIQKDSTIQYCPLFEGTSADPFLFGKDLIVSRVPFRIKSSTGTVYCPIKLEEVLNLSPTLTLYYKAGLNQQANSRQVAVSRGSGYQTWTEYYTEYQYNRQVVSYLKLNGSVSTTNKKASVAITGASCNGRNILNTYGTIQDRWSGWGAWGGGAPGYPTFNETHAVSVTYQVKLGSIVVKTGTVNIAISVPINSTTERATTLTLSL